MFWELSKFLSIPCKQVTDCTKVQCLVLEGLQGYVNFLTLIPAFSSFKRQ